MFRKITQGLVPSGLSTASTTRIQALINSVTANPTKIPGCVFASVNQAGERIFAHASGQRGIDCNEPMTVDSIFWIASFTKLITAISALQLIERGKLALDDADQLEELCPELQKMKILQGFDRFNKPIMVEKSNRITIRKCLTHTGKKPETVPFTLFSPSPTV